MIKIKSNKLRILIIVSCTLLVTAGIFLVLLIYLGDFLISNYPSYHNILTTTGPAIIGVITYLFFEKILFKVQKTNSKD